ncbi:hypothetical protein L228DRAFT_258802 [Xylona heveae TC161]|uniref:C2H2-type domain-containing protein n=1 Tax=Xylona heveae (strain CBS 132557 / TC161) TaxID=1328760 RepID=A0A165ITJ5_XYLHT|nr:hypothetical protein L228DRAFT_258802 [Xylona heveae TC161]KZF25369.1 hypothetical protein L228DRAFT_258802 [Xylona heveae TC161]
MSLQAATPIRVGLGVGPGMSTDLANLPPSYADLAGPRSSLQASQSQRTRPRSQDDDPAESREDAWSPTDDHAASAGGGPSKKRRRSRRDQDKKFDCPHEGCDKSYTRAEHLYRHQLNHTPKQIFYCDFPDCTRSFVRQDLCARHKERHTARGSHLQRKDAPLHTITPMANTVPLTGSASTPSSAQPQVQALSSPDLLRARSETFLNSNRVAASPGSHGPHPSTSSPARASIASTSPQAGVEHLHSRSQGGPLGRSNSDSSYRPQTSLRELQASSPSAPNHTHFERRPSMTGIDANQRVSPNSPAHSMPPGTSAAPTYVETTCGDNLQFSPSMNVTSSVSTLGYNHTSNMTGMSNAAFGLQRPYVPQHNLSTFSSLPPPTHPIATMTAQAVSSVASEAPFKTSPPANTTAELDNAMRAAAGAVTDASLLDQMAAFSVPMFGEGYVRSPFSLGDNFACWLFDPPPFGNAGSPPQVQTLDPTGYPGAFDPSGMQFQSSYYSSGIPMGGMYPPPLPPQHPMTVTSILDTNLPESVLSEEKRQEILDLIQMRFNETGQEPFGKQKETLLDGDRDQDNHILSLHMMQTYISSYWYHFHPQLPILHKPTFVADRTPNLLLIAIIAIGASCLDKMHGYDMTTACAELANFLAWHLRWEVFSDADFRPPAKLWIFQTLLLLELYEKMYSTRMLHERAHIHHATTITLMRRGSSLIGRSPLDSPPSVRDDKSRSNSGSVSGAPSVTTPEEWWSQWIANEATRRAAFVAFVIDSTHATMFGHSAVMVAHEMRLPLPCDEALWSATSSAEVGRVEASLHANGVKPLTFLEGLKKTLNGQPVRTNSFGRTILMAGLLSVSWHMNQRDLQVSSLGVTQALGGRDKWRGALTRAFDFWKRDFDDLLVSQPDGVSTPYHYSNGLDEENVYEGRTVLHHLAHMAMHVDTVDCQIFAGATRLLGRSITKVDYHAAQRRMRENWAPSARARDATFYALRFLRQVLLPEENPHIGPAKAASAPETFDYSARDDFLLNRPWVLYYSALIVWSYGFALDGRVQPGQLPDLSTTELKVRDMRGFLRRVGGVRSPDDLAHIRDRNSCIGMLMLLSDMYQKTRWELLHEGARLLSIAGKKLKGEIE